MRSLASILVLLGLSFSAQSQFTILPTGTTSSIMDIAKDGDTLIISGALNYFAKSYNMGDTLISFAPPGPLGYYNDEFQVVNGYYYIMSAEGFPYDHNYILRSKDYGNTWETLYDTTGLFYSFTMLDTTFGVMSGQYGSYVMTQGSDTVWMLDTLYSAIVASQAHGDSTMLMMSVGSMSYITEDRGQNWTWVPGTGSQTHEEIQFISEDTVYAISHSGTTNPKSFFYYSYNGGYSWSWVDIAYNDSTLGHDYFSRVYDLHFDSPQHGYMVGYNYSINQAAIFETNNYGIDWTMNPIGINEELYSLLNVNDSIAFIGGDNGLLLKWDKNIPLTNVLTVQEISVGSVVQLFPNPFREDATFAVNGEKLPAIMRIYDRLGRIVRIEIIKSPEFTFHRNELNAGVYYFQINNHTGKMVITD